MRNLVFLLFSTSILLADDLIVDKSSLSEYQSDNYLRFDLPEISDVRLTIYNVLGKRVKSFKMQNTPAGYHSIRWDATNDFGSPVSAGVYLYQLQAKDFVKTKKMILLK